MIKIMSPYQNKEWARFFPAGGWQGATKEHSQSSVTEEQRSQVPARKQPSGLPIFALLRRCSSVEDP
jgi:hypothetical protein